MSESSLDIKTVMQLCQGDKGGSRSETVMSDGEYAVDRNGNLYEITLHIVPSNFPETGRTICISKVGPIVDNYSTTRIFLKIQIPDVFSYEDIIDVIKQIRWDIEHEFGEKDTVASIKFLVNSTERLLTEEYDTTEAFQKLGNAVIAAIKAGVLSGDAPTFEPISTLSPKVKLTDLLGTEYFYEFGSTTTLLTINKVTFIIQDNALVEIQASTYIPTGKISEIHETCVSLEQREAVLVINRETAYLEDVETTFLPSNVNFFIDKLTLAIQNKFEQLVQ